MPSQKIKCPICGEPMKKRDIPQGLEIDFCDEHGVWLDVGELEAVAAQAQAERSGKSGESLGKSIGKQLGRSALFGAGATVGHRIVSGLIDAVFDR